MTMVKNSKPVSCTFLRISSVYAALALTVFCRSIVFVFAKYAALETSDTGVVQILFNCWYWAEIVVLGVQAIFWIYVLKHLDLSVAYSAMALVYAINLGWAWYLFDETVTWVDVLGCIVIIIGVITVTSAGQVKLAC